jgi:hypothetical protein
VVRRALVVVALALALASCRLDADVAVTVGTDGSGEIAVAATVDADVVQQVPGLAGALSVDDATAEGWIVEGPTATEAGGLTVALRHPFSSVAEASNLLNSLGPPFAAIALTQVADPPDGAPDTITTTLAGSLVLPGGTFEAFADSDLLAAAGPPFGAELAASGATPATAMAVRLTVTLPGEIEETTGARDGAAVGWDAPLDGSTADLATRAVLGGDAGGGWARPLATIALALLVVWLVIAAALVVAVVRARRRRAARTRYR